LAQAKERAQQRAESSLAQLAQLNQAVSHEVDAAREALRPLGNEGLIADPSPATTPPSTEVEPEQAVQAVREAVANLKATVLAQRIAPTRPFVAHTAVPPPRDTSTVTSPPPGGPPRIQTQTVITIGIVFAVIVACAVLMSATRLIDRLANQPPDVTTNNAQTNQHRTTTTEMTASTETTASTTASTTGTTTSPRPSPARPTSSPVRRGPVTGTIISHNDTKLKTRPTLDDHATLIVRLIPVGATVMVYCQVTGPVVMQDNGYGNDLWDWIEYDGSTGYIADALVFTGATTSTQVDRC